MRKECKRFYWALRNAQFGAKMMRKFRLALKEPEIFSKIREIFCSSRGLHSSRQGDQSGEMLRAYECCGPVNFLFFRKSFFLFVFFSSFSLSFLFFPLFPFFSFCLGSPGSDSFFEFEVSKFQSSKFQDSTVKLCTLKTSSFKVRSFKVQSFGV